MASSIFSCYLLFRKKKQHKYIHVCDIAVCDTEEQTSKMKAVKHKLCPFFPVRTQNYRCTDIKTQINKKNRNTAIQSSLHICCRMKASLVRRRLPCTQRRDADGQHCYLQKRCFLCSHAQEHHAPRSVAKMRLVTLIATCNSLCFQSFLQNATI